MLLSEILNLDEKLRALRSTVAVVDRIHHFPQLLEFPVVATRGRYEAGSYVGLFRPKVPVRICISVHARYPDLTLLHEVGHMLDHMAFKPVKPGYGSEHAVEFDSLRKLWRTSKTVRLMERVAMSRRRVATAQDRRFLQYQLLPRELWARTYVQWICARAQDARVGELLKKSREEGSVFAGVSCSFYWEDEEFNDIIVAVEELFRDASLI